MPHITFKKSKKDLIVPSEFDGTKFNFMAKSYNFTQKTRIPEYKICVQREDKTFY